MPLPEDFHELARRVCNWGRWGADDERGTLNLITPDVSGGLPRACGRGNVSCWRYRYRPRDRRRC